MKRYAFIDIPNTNGTAKNCLDFSVDWRKLYELLTNKKWECLDIFFYKGYKGDKEKQQLEKIKDLGYKVRTKLTHIHPDKNKDILVKCNTCKVEFLHNYIIKGNQKSNCDVELTVDALDILSKGDEALIFTGDGDFAYLVENLIKKGIIVTLISSQQKDKNGNIRFSTRLKDILKKEEVMEKEKSVKKRVRFINLNNWKKILEK